MEGATSKNAMLPGRFGLQRWQWKKIYLFVDLDIAISYSSQVFIFEVTLNQVLVTSQGWYFLEELHYLF